MPAAVEPEPPKRSAGSLTTRRAQLDWPADRDFRILSIDGGGIRGIFPSAVLAGLERSHLAGASVAAYFDLIVGTSTGGIIALGLAAGLSAAEIRDLYLNRGCEIFPSHGAGFLGRAKRRLKGARHLLSHLYDEAALARLLTETFGDRKFGTARTRLCIPSFDGRHGEVFIFKTPHHPDFKKDLHEPMTKVALATSAAPTYFRPHRHGGYTFVDGGVWANNPIMIGLVEALASFTVPRERVRILSLGCGNDPYAVQDSQVTWGGIWHWRKIIFAAMSLQSQNAIGQARLLIGADRVIRVDLPPLTPAIELDDWRRATKELPSLAEAALAQYGDDIATRFLDSFAAPYEPVIKVE